MFEYIFGADIEATGLINALKEQGDKARLHVFGYKRIDINTNADVFHYTQKEELQAFFDTSPTLVIHNGITFDQPALSILGYDTSKVTIIDTLYLSWYLFPHRMRHGLEVWGDELGFKKPEVADGDWARTDLPIDYFDVRVKGDVEIQVRLWHFLSGKLDELYGKGKWKKLLQLLMWKGKQQAMQQERGWKFDSPKAAALLVELEARVAEKKKALAESMPKVKISTIKSRPKKCFLGNGKLSAAGLAWSKLTLDRGLPFEYTEDIEVITGWEEGNPASHKQIKDWLFSLGWQPLTFKFDKDKNTGEEKKIPQIQDKEKDDGAGGLCDSVLELVEQDAGIVHLDGLGRISHRRSLVRKMLEDEYDGTVTARCAGFTNTLRLRHKELVNLPSDRVEYGLEIRGNLVAREGKVLLGSDLSSLEDRLKHHFQIPLDPEYVKSQMTKGFDPHLAIASKASLVSQAQINKFVQYKDMEKRGIELNPEQQAEYDAIGLIRSSGKTTNYACQYGAGVATVARSAKISYQLAEKLHKGYWDMNWTIKTIAGATTTKETSFGTFQYNPISGLWYSLRSDKDRFSTLIQGSGAYVLDLWLLKLRDVLKEKDLPFHLLGQFHDELIIELDEGLEGVYEEAVLEALNRVNQTLKLNRELACDVKFGKTYAEIH